MQARSLPAAYFIKTMGRCGFDPAAMSFHGTAVEQAKCLMRGMDQSRNLGPGVASLPAPLADRVANETGLPSREVLSTYLSKLDLELDFAAYLLAAGVARQRQRSRCADGRYLLHHRSSGPNFGHRSFPEEVDDGTSNINSLNKFRCSDGWERRMS